MPPKASTASTVKNKKIIKIIDDIVKTKPNLKGVAKVFLSMYQQC